MFAYTLPTHLRYQTEKYTDINIYPMAVSEITVPSAIRKPPFVVLWV